ncbi:dolichyl-diphosphooligosaccharide--protein glycosyltransferase subunit 1 [Cimex lectularius]|uniref:Dolichyl-diphosphooligosaccharide--protein glycosyltransferase subunit 1 n=1 Tax=Cimex lectularius TaxID=79782 RepID=A0A8I6RLQ1_CIMLE|nr:dolichyl-diphosphooligosaccharide--protein glycosyltransferase subunit 1 [Cimex lectularius]
MFIHSYCAPLVVFMVAFSICSGQDVLIQDILVKNADRLIDVSSQLCKVAIKLQIENVGKSPVNKFIFSLDPVFKPKLAHISAQLTDTTKSPLKILSTKINGKPDGAFWRVDLKDQLRPEKTLNLEIEYVLTHTLTPYPTAITQKEKQLVRYSGNHYIHLPYYVEKQTTVVNLGSRNIESYSKLNPVSLLDSTITYGPYNKVKPFAFDALTVHYENNSPFLTVTKLERSIEVSHWGNIAVEEVVDMVHTGATLKGPFSRYDFQRETHSGLSSVKSFKTILPASATDAYYRDDIGNISTSHMRLLSDSVELDLRPRFPLFGGWKTHYVLGYNVPSYEYLFNSGDVYKLKMRVLDHVFDDMVVDELVTKIILPEGADELQLVTPYSMTRLPNTRHSTYLDTKGRLVITVTKKNLVENHIQSFELDYAFPRILMLLEPCLVTTALYLLFLLVIIYVRLDFSISKDEAGESRLRVSGILDKLLQHFDKRATTYSQLDDQFAKVKTSKDVTSYNNASKTINQEYKIETNHIMELMAKLKPDAPEVCEKISEIQKLDRNLKEIYNQKQALYVDKLIPGKVGRGAFIETETTINKKKDETVEKINALIKNLH